MKNKFRVWFSAVVMRSDSRPLDHRDYISSADISEERAKFIASEVYQRFQELMMENPAAQEAEFAIMHAHLAGGFEPPPPGAMKPGSEWARQIPIPSDAIFSGDAWGDAMKNLLRGK